MKGPTLALFLFSVLLTAVQARGRETVKLCGLDYVRTVVYICASSRWRRHLEQVPPTQRGNWAHAPHLFPPRSLFLHSPPVILVAISLRNTDLLVYQCRWFIIKIHLWIWPGKRWTHYCLESNAWLFFSLPLAIISLHGTSASVASMSQAVNAIERPDRYLHTNDYRVH